MLPIAMTVIVSIMIGNSCRRGHECNSQCFWVRRITRDFKRHRFRDKHVSRLLVSPCVDRSSRFNILSDIQSSCQNTLLLCPGRGTVLLAVAPSYPFQSTNDCVSLLLQGSVTRVGTLTVATIYLQLIQNRYIFRSFTVLQCSHQHCVQPVASDVEVVGYF